MPRGNRTGPMGAGPMTGWGYGPCGMGLNWHHELGLDHGMGRFFGWGFNPPQTKKDQLQALTQYQKTLEEGLEDVKTQIAALKKGE